MRLFVALPLPVEVRAPLDDAVEPVRRRHARLRWTRSDGWHLTLAFLGQVADDRLEEVVAAVRRGTRDAPAPRRLRLGDAGRFGRRVLWVEVEDDPAGAVAELGARVQESLVDAGLLAETRPVRAHVTLARASSAVAVGPGLVEEVTTPSLAWEPAAVELWSSLLGRGPARYRSEAVLPLDG